MYSEEDNNGIYLEKQVRSPNFSMNYEHFHEYYEFFFLNSGSCSYTVNQTVHHLSAGDLFFVTPGDYHSTRYEGTSSCERTIVYCSPHIFPDYFVSEHSALMQALSRSGKVVMEKKGKTQLEALIQGMLAENNFPDKHSNHILQLQMMAFLLMLDRSGIFVYEQLKKIADISSDIDDTLQYIAKNFTMPLTLEEVAKEVNLAPSYLSRKFKKVTGTTFKEYVNFIRIKQATQMLLTTDDSITKIALNCGFNSSNYFKDCFRRINGMSPRDYRRYAQSHSFA